MNGTKRKFNTLLQGINAAKTVSHDQEMAQRSDNGLNEHSMTDTASNVQKRRRVGATDQTAVSLASQSTRTYSSSSTATHILSKDSGRPASRYCPGERHELLNRLRTFQEITHWTPKADQVSELEWAKRGWVCQGKEKVRCVLCHRELLIKLETQPEETNKSEDPADLQTALVKKYADLIMSAHQTDCLWRKRGCDDNLLRLSFANTQRTIASLKRRYSELYERKSLLPYEFNIKLPQGVDLNDSVSKLSPDFFDGASHDDAATSPAANRVALALALTGWQGLTDARVGKISSSAACNTCLRRLGLWMFKSKEVDESGQVAIPAPMDFLDTIREHRFFCPWRNKHYQRRDVRSPADQNDAPAWQILAQTIANDASLRQMYSGTPKKEEKLSTETSSLHGQLGSGTQAVGHSASDKGNVVDQDDDDSLRTVKDKERWARLRKVKSLFDPKGVNKLRRSLNRPGSGHSNTPDVSKK